MPRTTDNSPTLNAFTFLGYVIHSIVSIISNESLSAEYLRTFNDPSATSQDYFGGGVAIDGNLVLVGNIGDDTYGISTGQAHLFDADTDSVLLTFNDPTPNIYGRFGYGVALENNQVLIGNFGDDTYGRDVGQAHLFNARSGDLIHTFDDPTPTSGDYFGGSIALNSDFALIGAPYDDTLGEDVGQVHLFDVTSGSLLRTFNDPTPTPTSFYGDEFGRSVALIGNKALIGAPGDRTHGTLVGQAHLFDIITGQLIHTFNDPTPTPGRLSGDEFGRSVAISENFALIGAPNDDTYDFQVGQVHLYDLETGNLLRTFDDPNPIRNGIFGTSVAIENGTILIGASRDTVQNEVGYAYLYDANTGLLLDTLSDSTPVVSDQIGVILDAFGSSVAMDGNLAVIGAPFDHTAGDFIGQVHLYQFSVPEPSTAYMLLSTTVVAVLGTNQRIFKII